MTDGVACAEQMSARQLAECGKPVVQGAQRIADPANVFIQIAALHEAEPAGKRQPRNLVPPDGRRLGEVGARSLRRGDFAGPLR